jgi:hypothetical protein
MCGRSTCKIVVMADWQFLRTGNKSNNHRSLHKCLLARARQPHAAAACGAWARMSVACAVRCASSTRAAAVHATTWRARALRHPRACRWMAGRLPWARASSCSTAWRSPTRAQRRVAFGRARRSGPPAACVRRACAGPAPCAEYRRRNLHGRWRRHVPREQHDHAHAGGAPGPTHAITRMRTLVVLACGASTGSGSGGQPD